MWSTSAPTATADRRVNRARLTAEVVEAVAAEIGAGPGRAAHLAGELGAGDMREVDDVSAYEALLDRIAPLGLAYLHVLIDPDNADVRDACARCGTARWCSTPAREVDTDFCQLEALADWGVIGAAAVGRAFLANPDLIDRLRLGAELNEPDVATFYAPGPQGYIDYPTLAEAEQLQSA